MKTMRDSRLCHCVMLVLLRLDQVLGMPQLQHRCTMSRMYMLLAMHALIALTPCYWCLCPQDIAVIPFLVLLPLIENGGMKTEVRDVGKQGARQYSDIGIYGSTAYEHITRRLCG